MSRFTSSRSHTRLCPPPNCRAQWRRLLAADGQGHVRERQLDAGRRAAGGAQHGHRAAPGVWGVLAPLQARHVRPLEQTAPQGQWRSRRRPLLPLKKFLFVFFFVCFKVVRYLRESRQLFLVE